jgi:hypothetical protein
MSGPHALFNRLELTAGLDHAGHVKLVLEVSGGHVERLGHAFYNVGLLQVPGERLFADYSFDPGSALDCLGYIAHYVDANVIRRENTDHIHRSAEIGNALKHLGIAQPVLASTLGKSLRSHRRTDSGELDAANRTQRPLVKSRYETRSNHSYFQHRSIPFIVKSRSTDNPYFRRTPKCCIDYAGDLIIYNNPGKKTTQNCIAVLIDGNCLSESPHRPKWEYENGISDPEPRVIPEFAEKQSGGQLSP